MKRIVSISLGSSKRDKQVKVDFFGEEFDISRIGVDGDMKLFQDRLRELDGKIDAFGVGGADIYVYSGDKKYAMPEILRLMSPVKITPYVDGSGLKNTLEREAVKWLQESGKIDFRSKRVLMVCSVDRFGMSETLAKYAKSIVVGDLMFNLGLPFPIHSWDTAKKLGRILLPVVIRLPYKWLYPTGEKQNVNTPKFQSHFENADVIAGDFHLIRRYMPERLNSKIILTNTTTAEDEIELRRRGASQLITTTPVFEGRSFGTNVMEAALVTLLGKPPEQLTPQDYFEKFQELNWKPEIRILN